MVDQAGTPGSHGPQQRVSETGDRPSAAPSVSGQLRRKNMPRTLSVKEIVRQIGAQNRDAKLMEILEELDRDGSGQIDVAELIELLEGVRRGRKERKYMCIAMISMLVFGAVLIGTIIGLTYAMMYSLKDTEVKGGVMFVKKSDGTAGDVVRTGSADFSVVNGAMVQRAVTNTGTNDTANVLRTANFMGAPQSLNSEIDIGELLELKYLLINGTGKAQLGLVVLGVGRVPLEGSVHGTVLHIVTAAGTITLDGTAITFSAAIADIFAAAGFRVSGTRRALLGSYAVLGFFNTIKDLSAAGKPPSQPEPKLPSENFVMKLKVYEPCAIAERPDTDRCIYIPPKPAATQDSDPPPPSPIAPSPPMLTPNSTLNGTGNGTYDDTGNGTRRALGEQWPSSSAPIPSRRRLRHAWVATRPTLQGTQSNRRRSRALADAANLDLAGVELHNGVRYMTHNETTISYGGNTRIMYDFALYPLWQKIEVVLGNTVYAWQENVLPDGNSTNEVMQFFCGNYSVGTPGAAGVNASSVLNYTYNGVDSIGDRLARHFELNVLQLSDNVGAADVMRVDYWDSLNDFTPLRFQFTHKDIGTVLVDVLEFRSINASSPEAMPAMFDVPALKPGFNCPNYPSIPRLSSPFMARGAVVSTDPPIVADDPADGRRLMAQDTDALELQWNDMGGAHRTGSGGQWSLDVYGGVHPAAAARRELGECGTATTIGMDIDPCGFDYTGYKNGDFALSVRCGGEIGPVELTGSIGADTCSGTFSGCLGLSIGLPKSNWLVKKIGIDLSIDIASACVGYNYKEDYFYIEASLTLDLVVFRAELNMEMDFSSCCIWISSVNLEASVGVSFLNIWVTVGDIDIVTDVYLRGSPEAQEETANPTALNLASSGWVSVGDGFWGDWQKVTYPCSRFTWNQNKGTMELIGLPMNSYQLRVEPEQGGNDDTALNGLSVGCFTGTANTVEGNNGYWGTWSASASCPAGGYFVGAKMRIEKDQGPYKDDTAANSIIFTCSNSRGTELVAHRGFYGDWTGWTYCPGESYICGLQVRVETPGGDDTAMNGLRIACCNFPTNTETVVTSAGIIKTLGSASSSTCLDVYYNNQSPGTYIQQYACSNSGTNAAQYFTISSTPTGAYTIATTQKGYCLTVQNGGSSAGTRIILDNCVNGARNQAWSVSPVGPSLYTLSPTHASGMCLDISGGTSANGANVQLWGCNQTPAQSFYLNLPTRSTTGTLGGLAGQYKKCLDVSGNKQSPSTLLQSWDCNETGAQQFTITAAGTNYYQIKSAGGYCVTTSPTKLSVFSLSITRIMLDNCVDSATNQLWKASAGFDGGVSLSPYADSGSCLEVLRSGLENGTIVHANTCNGGKAQSWKVNLPVS